MSEFEWDPAKEQKNIKERDLDFTTASRIWNGPVLEKIDMRRDYGEARILAFGKIDDSGSVHMTWGQAPHHFRSKGESA